MSSVPKYEVVFVGAGMMATAMVKSLLKAGTYQAGQIACCSAPDGTAERLQEATGIAIVDADATGGFQANVLVLACKPQQLTTLSEAVIANAEGALLISILAGTTIDKLSAKFPTARNVVRVMPNTPGSIGEGISAYAPKVHLNAADIVPVHGLLAALGEYLEVAEERIDAVTAISGSGPAYLFYFAEALIVSAKALGFNDADAAKLARKTITGSAALLAASDKAPDELRLQVTSPGGTTQAAIESMQVDDLIGLVKKATTAARDRSIELSQLD